MLVSPEEARSRCRKSAHLKVTFKLGAVHFNLVVVRFSPHADVLEELDRGATQLAERIPEPDLPERILVDDVGDHPVANQSPKRLGKGLGTDPTNCLTELKVPPRPIAKLEQHGRDPLAGQGRQDILGAPELISAMTQHPHARPVAVAVSVAERARRHPCPNFIRHL